MTIKMSHIVAALLFASVSVAHAETANQPVTQGEASVDKNLNKNKDNKGLQNADQRLEANQAKIAAKRADADKTADTAKQKKNKAERHERMENHERMEKMERMEKVERPDRIERPGK